MRRTTSSEQDLRVDLLNTLLTTPHRELGKVAKVHQSLFNQDPIFYTHLGAWYFENGEIRDHKEMFVTILCTALRIIKLTDDKGHPVEVGIGDSTYRNVGLALLRNLPPYEVRRVFDFVKGVTTPPRSFRTEIIRYLREREADQDKFDSAVLVARKHLKRLYASLRIKPSPYADAILFKDKPPVDSKLFALKGISKMKDPTEQAKAIVKHNIPYRVASTIIRSITPSVLVALINAMSHQELINNISSLKRHGSFNNPKVRELVSKKLESAKKGKRVSAFKAKEAIRVSGVKGALKKQLEEVTEEQIKVKGKIKRPTALLCDKSGSLLEAIEVAKRVGSMISSICESDLFVYAFDNIAYKIDVKGKKLTDWEESFKGINANGNTSCGIALDHMRRKKEYVEQIIMITDEEENTHPYFLDSLQKYREELKADPSILFIKVGDFSRLLEEQCRSNRLPFDAYEFSGDLYALPSIIPFITKPSRLELIVEIMSYPLPQRLSS